MSLPIKAVIKVAGDSDCTIRVVVKDATNDPPARHAVDFRVHRQTVAASSNFLKVMLTSRDFADTGKDVVEFTEITPTVMLIILFRVHAQLAERMQGVLQQPQLEHFWELAAKIDEFGLDIKRFKGRFERWRLSNIKLLEERPQDLLYPTWEFDDAIGFQRITKHLAYNHVGHIVEGNPTKFRQYHLPERVIGKWWPLSNHYRIL